MAYATIEDVTAGMMRDVSEDETRVLTQLLDEVAVIIDAYNSKASVDAKNLVSVRVVRRQIGDGESSGVPIGATQGTVTALGYSQTWTLSSGSAGEAYLSKIDKALLGKDNAIGSRSPVEDLVPND